MKFFAFVSAWLLVGYAFTGRNIEQPLTWLLICFWWAIVLAPSYSGVKETCVETIKEESKK